MAFKCDRCRKGKHIATRQKHKKGVAGGKWKYRAPKSRKISLPNLHSFKGILKGKKGKWRLCTKCLRIVKKEQKTHREKSINLAIAKKVANSAKKKSSAPMV